MYTDSPTNQKIYWKTKQIDLLPQQKIGEGKFYFFFCPKKEINIIYKASMLPPRAKDISLGEKNTAGNFRANSLGEKKSAARN